MTYRSRSLVAFATLTLGLTLAAGCTELAGSLGQPSGPQTYGRVSFAVNLPKSDRATAALADVVDHLDVTLSGANLTAPMATTLTHEQIAGGSAAAAFERVPAGPAVLSVSVEDAANNELAAGSANVTVIAGREAVANLTLSVPTTGSVSSTITLVEATPTPAPTPTPELAQTATVTMAGSVFAPSTLEIAQGGQVTFVNNDSMPHTVSPTGGASFTGSGNLPAGGQATLTFNTVGTQAYQCDYHGGMTGTVVVR